LIDFLTPTHHVKYNGFCVLDLQNSRNTPMFANAPRKLRWILRSRHLFGPLSSETALKNRSRKRKTKTSAILTKITLKTTQKMIPKPPENASGFDAALFRFKNAFRTPKPEEIHNCKSTPPNHSKSIQIRPPTWDPKWSKSRPKTISENALVPFRAQKLIKRRIAPILRPNLDAQMPETTPKRTSKSIPRRPSDTPTRAPNRVTKFAPTYESII
jgi:hypothetical protein